MRGTPAQRVDRQKSSISISATKSSRCETQVLSTGEWVDRTTDEADEGADRPFRQVSDVVDVEDQRMAEPDSPEKFLEQAEDWRNQAWYQWWDNRTPANKERLERAEAAVAGARRNVERNTAPPFGPNIMSSCHVSPDARVRLPRPV